MSAVRSLLDSLWADDEKDFPVFPGNKDHDREQQLIDSSDFSRFSRISRSKTQDVEPDNNASALQLQSDAGAGARGEYVSDDPGNPGTPGNDSLHNGFHFPVEISKTGKREILSAGEPQAGPRLSAGAARSGWADLDRIAPPAVKGSETVEGWRTAFYDLSSIEPPCPGFRLSMDWRQTFDAAHAFLEQHAEQAHALGWSTLDLFAVHHRVGGTRVDCCGGVMLMAGREVLSIDRDTIALRRLRDGQPCGRFLRTRHNPEMVPVWNFGR